MSRRSFLLTLTILVMSVALIGLIAIGLLRYQSHWYQNAWLKPGPERQQQAQDCLRAFSDLYSQITNDRDWTCQFNDSQLNAFFEDGLKQSGMQVIIPDDMRDLRFSFEQDRVRMAFRYGIGLFSTVIQINLRIWKASQEPNVLVLELEGLYAGALPFAGRSILEKLSEIGRQNGIGVSWFRNQKTGHAVAVLRFQDNLPRPNLEIDAIHVARGVMGMSGHFIDASGGSRNP